MKTKMMSDISINTIKVISTIIGQYGRVFADSIETLRMVGTLEKVLPFITELDVQTVDGNLWLDTLNSIRCHDGNDPLVNLCLLFLNIDKLSVNTHDVIDSTIERLGFGYAVADAIKYCLEHYRQFDCIKQITPSSKCVKLWVSLMDNSYWHVLKQVVFCYEKSRKNFDPIEWGKTNCMFSRIENIYGTENPMSMLRSIVNRKMIVDLCGDVPDGEVMRIAQKTIDEILTHNINFKDNDEINKIVMSHIKS